MEKFKITFQKSLSLILLININIFNFNLLKKNKDFIKRIIYDEIIINGEKYKLYG